MNRTFKQWVDAQESFGCDSDTVRDFGHWLVAPCGRHRDSDCLEESNHAAVLAELHEAHDNTRILRMDGGAETVQVLRFGHWAVGWTEIIVCAPEHGPTLDAIRERLENYPVLDEDDFREREHEEANRIWHDCYSITERIAYIREHPDHFEFRSLPNMLGCVRGRYFAGWDSELIS